MFEVYLKIGPIMKKLFLLSFCFLSAGGVTLCSSFSAHAATVQEDIFIEETDTPVIDATTNPYNRCGVNGISCNDTALINYTKTEADYRAYGERTKRDHLYTQSSAGNNLAASIRPGLEEDVVTFPTEVLASANNQATKYVIDDGVFSETGSLDLDTTPSDTEAVSVDEQQAPAKRKYVKTDRVVEEVIVKETPNGRMYVRQVPVRRSYGNKYANDVKRKQITTTKEIQEIERTENHKPTRSYAIARAKRNDGTMKVAYNDTMGASEPIAKVSGSQKRVSFSDDGIAASAATGAYSEDKALTPTSSGQKRVRIVKNTTNPISQDVSDEASSVAANTSDQVSPSVVKDIDDEVTGSYEEITLHQGKANEPKKKVTTTRQVITSYDRENDAQTNNKSQAYEIVCEEECDDDLLYDDDSITSEFSEDSFNIEDFVEEDGIEFTTVGDSSSIVSDISIDDIKVSDDTILTWEAEEGENLRELLTKWSAMSGWKLLWNTNRNYILSAGVMFKGKFADVSSALVRAFARARPAPIATYYKGNRVIVIETMENENAY